MNRRDTGKTGFAVIAVLLFLASGCAGLSRQEKDHLSKLEISAEAMQERLQKRLADNPESALENAIQVLHEVLSYADQVKADPKKFNAEQIEKYNERIDIINENIERFKDVTLQADVTFPLGTYKLSDLSEAGQGQCASLASRIIATVQELNVRYPEYPIRVTLKTVGYTDEIPVVSGALQKAILSEINQVKPRGPERRKQYNQVLSRFRAETLSDFILDQLNTGLPSGVSVHVVPKIVGLGEAFPKKNMQPPFRTRDARRRICVISPFIEILLD